MRAPLTAKLLRRFPIKTQKKETV